METSVVVVSSKPGPWLRRCLDSVVDQADEVVVVDNGSPGRWATSVAAGFGARVVALDRNTGFACGVNRGLAASRGGVVALLNDDAFPANGWLRRSGAVLADPTVAAVAPKLLLDRAYLEISLDEPVRYAPPDPRPLGRQVVSLTVDGVDVLADALGPGIYELEAGPPGPPRWRWTAGSGPIYVPAPDGGAGGDVECNGEQVVVRDVVELVNNAGSYLSREGYGGDYGYETPDRGAFDQPGDRFAACGAAMVMRADTVQRLGLFAGELFAYYEDTDWCWRAQLAGLRIVYEPQAVVRHVRGATSGGSSQAWVRRLSGRNRLAMLVRNAPRRIALRALWRARQSESWPELRPSVAKLLPWALRQRWLLSRGWALDPEEVWRRWAGVNEQWPLEGRSVIC